MDSLILPELNLFGENDVMIIIIDLINNLTVDLIIDLVLVTPTHNNAKALLDYELCKLTIRCGEKLIVVKCRHWTTPPVPKQSPEENESDESNDEESEEKEEQEETAELTYTIFTSNGKPLDNVKADKERIIVNGKLICWPYYDMLRRTFDRKPNTVIGGMVLVPGAGVTNHCILLVMNACPA
ncbi:hypothetical protein G9A89_018774 [Geosiphon pyriformis]|nr:hypothetical protein G9A89_018774 [Geosiphon pyriformis]